MDRAAAETHGAVKDAAHITPDGQLTLERIAGVRTQEMRPIVTGNGVTTELFRKDWGVAAGELVHMIHVSLLPGAVSAWHMHRVQTDHLVPIAGQLRVVLYDDREGSPTRGKLDVFNLGAMRPTLLVIPPEIWHGIQARPSEPGVFVNFFDHAYDYSAPDEWRLPADSEEIPFRF